jgi:hypothetical protein
MNGLGHMHAQEILCNSLGSVQPHAYAAKLTELEDSTSDVHKSKEPSIRAVSTSLENVAVSASSQPPTQFKHVNCLLTAATCAIK